MNISCIQTGEFVFKVPNKYLSYCVFAFVSNCIYTYTYYRCSTHANPNWSAFNENIIPNLNEKIAYKMFSNNA